MSNCKIYVKQFWQYMNSHLKTCPTISVLKCQITLPLILIKKNQFFASVFTKNTPFSSSSLYLDCNVLLLIDIKVTPIIVWSPGLKGWPVLSYKENAQQFCISLSIILFIKFWHVERKFCYTSLLSIRRVTEILAVLIIIKLFVSSVLATSPVMESIMY